MAGSTSQLLTREQVAGTDQLLPEVRWVSALVVLALITAGIILYLFPDHTTELFAWTINPRMTPLFMGAGYAAGAYFFARGLQGRRWHRFAAYFPGISSFTWLMGIATLLHWDKFNHSHISFLAWAVLYFTTPVIVPLLWWRNRLADPGTPEPDDVVVPSLLRQFIRLIGVGMLGFALLIFLLPSSIIAFWPWMLTPLTARVSGAFMAAPGLTMLLLAGDSRWSAWQVLVEHQTLASALLLLALLRAWSDVDPANPITWIFSAGMLFLLVGGIAFYYSMERQRPKSTV